MATRLLAQERMKFALLTTKPANPAQPTPTELNATSAIDASCLVLREGFRWGAAASEAINEPALCAGINAQTPGSGNSDLSMTAWRWFDNTGAVDAVADKLFAAVKTKGTTLWGYLRNNGKPYTAAWAAGEEIAYGAEFVVDTPQLPTDLSGFIKYVIPCMAQNAWPFTTVGSGT